MNPAFECLLAAAQHRRLRAEPEQLIDLNLDSLRFCTLGNSLAPYGVRGLK